MLRNAAGLVPGSRRAALLAAPLGVLLLCGHVGSPTVFFDGAAGPFPVHVVVRPPGVIPGRAEVAVRISPEPVARGVSRVTVRPLQWDAGRAGAPPADEAERVRGERGLWTAQLWLMTASSYDIEVEVEGRVERAASGQQGGPSPRPADGPSTGRPTAPMGEGQGRGTVVVPLSTARTRALGMQRGLGVTLAALGLFLFGGLINLVAAGVRESTLPAGEAPSDGRRRAARRAMVVCGILLAAALAGGKHWWDAVDQAFRQRLFRPFSCSATARAEGSGRRLDLVIHDPRWTSGEQGDLLPEHGKLVHLFLIREPGLDAFGHLHPVRLGPARFAATLPPLPAGSYRLYADITQESGFAQTLTTTVRLPTPPPPPAPTDAAPQVLPDLDDSFRLSPALTIRPQAVAAISPLNGGLTMTWQRRTSPLVAGREVTLRFATGNPDGSPVPLEPYMGMLGHAVVLREDGGVFVHLHPMGTVSMSAQQALTRHLRGGAATDPGPARTTTTDAASPAATATGGMPGMSGMEGPGADGARTGEVTFPYEFPAPGRYRIWVQVKCGGHILTGVFDTEVGRAG